MGVRFPLLTSFLRIQFVEFVKFVAKNSPRSLRLGDGRKRHLLRLLPMEFPRNLIQYPPRHRRAEEGHAPASGADGGDGLG